MRYFKYFIFFIIFVLFSISVFYYYIGVQLKNSLMEATIGISEFLTDGLEPCSLDNEDVYFIKSPMDTLAIIYSFVKCVQKDTIVIFIKNNQNDTSLAPNMLLKNTNSTLRATQ